MGRRRARLAIKVSVSVGLLAWVLHCAVGREGVGALGARVATIDPRWVLAALGLQMAAVTAGVVRWRALLAAEGLRLPVGRLARSYLIGRFVGAFTPSTTGLDIYRAVDIARWTGRRGASASVILVEKCVGLLGLSLLCLILLPLGEGRLLGPSAAWMALLVAAGSSAGLALLKRPARASRLLAFAPRRLRPAGQRVLDAVGARGLSAPLLLGTVGLSLASHLLASGVFVATSASLGLDVPPSEVLVVGTAIVVATLLPVSVGGVGVRESVAVLLLGAAGVGAADATLVALLGYLTAQGPAIAGGLLSLGPRGAGRAPHLQERKRTVVSISSSTLESASRT